MHEVTVSLRTKRTTILEFERTTGQFQAPFRPPLYYSVGHHKAAPLGSAQV